MGGEGSIIRKQHLPDENSAHLGLSTEAGQVEEVPVAPGVEEDAIFRLAEGIAQEKGEEHTEKCRGQDTPLLHAVLDWKGV